jgi:hypothetical protein
MTQRTRYFLVCSTLLVGVGLGIGVVAYYNGSLPLRSSTTGPAELAYVPRDTAALAFADVHSIVNSPFHQRLEQVLPHGDQQDWLRDQTGIDVRRDVQTVMAVFEAGPVSNTAPAAQDGAGPGARVDRSALVLLRGRFDESRIEALAQGHGAVREDYGGKTLFLADFGAAHDAATSGADAAPAARDHRGALAFLEPDLVAFGAESAVRAAIDTAASRNDITKNPEMMGFIAGVENAGNAWMVGQLDAIAHTDALPREIRDHVPPVDWFAVSALVDRGVRGHVRAEARDEAAGEQLRSVINGGLAAIRLMGADRDPRLSGVLSSLTAVGTGKNVELAFALPPEIEDLATHGGAAPHPAAASEPR